MSGNAGDESGPGYEKGRNHSFGHVDWLVSQFTLQSLTRLIRYGLMLYEPHYTTMQLESSLGAW